MGRASTSRQSHPCDSRSLAPVESRDKIVNVVNPTPLQHMRGYLWLLTSKDNTERKTDSICSFYIHPVVLFRCRKLFVCLVILSSHKFNQELYVPHTSSRQHLSTLKEEVNLEHVVNINIFLYIDHAKAQKD